MQHDHHPIFVLVVAALVGVASCRSKSERSASQTQTPPAKPAANAPPIAACSLLTDDEIKTATGRAVQAKKPATSQGIFSTGCQWTLQGGEGSGIPDIDLGVMSPGGLAYYEKYFERYLADPDQPLQKKRLEGVGDKGLVDETGNTMVVKHDVLISINYNAFPSNKTVATALAKLVVDHHLP